MLNPVMPTLITETQKAGRWISTYPIGPRHVCRYYSCIHARNSTKTCQPTFHQFTFSKSPKNYCAAHGANSIDHVCIQVLPFERLSMTQSQRSCSNVAFNPNEVRHQFDAAHTPPLPPGPPLGPGRSDGAAGLESKGSRMMCSDV